MGTGIGIVAARHADLNVTFVDTSDKQLSDSSKFIEKWCNKEMSKGRLTGEQKDNMISKINFSTTMKDLSHDSV